MNIITCSIIVGNRDNQIVPTVLSFIFFSTSRLNKYFLVESKTYFLAVRNVV